MVIMRRPLFILLFVVSAGWVGCSQDREEFGTDPGPFGSPDGGTADAAPPPECTGPVCSPDLRSVLDCSGNVIKECSADTACGNGECIAPCDAAALNEGSLGCSFAVTPSVESGESRGSCAAVFVANNWTSPATLHISYKGEEKALDGAVWVPYVEDGVLKHKPLEGPIPPGGGAVVFVSQETLLDAVSNVRAPCPSGVKPILWRDPALYGTGTGTAVFATADVPVSMYSLYPYGGAKSFNPSGTVLLPTTSFRKNYMLLSSWGGRDDIFGQGVLGPNRGQAGKPTVQIVAIEDDTSIDLLPKVSIAGGRGVPSYPANQVANIRLQRGEFLQLTQEGELTGSVLESNKPVGVFGGHSCMYVPSGVTACDSDNKQIPPLSAWGHEYAVLPAPDRVRLSGSRNDRSNELSVVRIVGAADGTELVYEPWKPDGAPTTLQSGELARFFIGTPFVVRSQDSAHPFYVATVMAGSEGSNAMLGDPETAMAIPTQQWLDEYGFFADYTYSRSAVFVTRRKANGVFHDVTLDCTGAISGWEPISDDYEWTYVELTRGQRSQTYPGGTCADGAHRIRSDVPFTMAVWGLSNAASYSYPGGMGLRRSTELELSVH
jgi:IgGFc binding protein